MATEADPLKPAEWAMLRRALARSSLIAYIRAVAPWFIIEEVHTVIAAHMEALCDGDIDRLLISLPPRTGKSMMGSVFLPSFWAGRYPSDKILQVGHSVELSRTFSLDVRELMRLPEYHWIFPGVRLAKDAQAAGKWRVEDTYTMMGKVEARQQRQQQGQYNAAGVTSNIAGKGFNLGICDDALSEQSKDSKITKDRLWNWWGPGFYTRRQPERNSILVMGTRWATDDLPGHLLEQMEKHHGADTWTVLNIPAILDADSARRIYTIAKEYGQIDDLIELKPGDSFAPRRWTLKELARSKANSTEADWNALYMGTPTDAQGHILKAKHWRLWPHDEPPECTMIFQMYDTAFDKKSQNDFSARTTWGIFEYREKQGERPSTHMILLDRWKARVEAPDLKTVAMVGAWGSKETRRALLKMDEEADLEFLESMVADAGGREIHGMNPDRILIENKASGIWLIKELRRIRRPKALPVSPWNGPRGGRGKEMGKFARACMASLVLEQGAVWYMKRNWAEEVIRECSNCRFDDSDQSDDLPDTVTSSMIYVRQTYRVELPTDIDEEEERRPPRREERRFYGTRA